MPVGSSDVRPTVAVIDHDSAARGSFEALLGGADYDVQLFRSSRDFLRQLPEIDADCILLEFRMPEDGGLVVLDALSQLTQRPPVIVMSTMPKLVSPRLARRLGALVVLDKPIEEGCLFAAIELAINPVTPR